MYRKRLNPDADDNNTLKLAKSQTGCCPDGYIYTECMYEITVDPFVNAASITITKEDGTTATQAFSGTITDKTLLPGEIRVALEKLGYIQDDKIPNAEVLTDGTEVTIRIYGEAVVVRLDQADDTDLDATAKCNKNVVCDFTSTADGTSVTLQVDGGASGNVGDGSWTFPTEAAALETALKADAKLTGYIDITVVADTDASVFVVTITFDAASEIVLAGKTMIKENCRPIYIA